MRERNVGVDAEFGSEKVERGVSLVKAAFQCDRHHGVEPLVERLYAPRGRTGHRRRYSNGP